MKTSERIEELEKFVVKLQGQIDEFENAIDEDDLNWEEARTHASAMIELLNKAIDLIDDDEEES
jgi:hypothetical protein